MQSIVEIDRKDLKLAAPAVLTMLAIPLTFSIAEGIGIGIICAALLAITLGEAKKVTTLGYVVAVVFFLEFFKIWPFS